MRYNVQYVYTVNINQIIVLFPSFLDNSKFCFIHKAQCGFPHTCTCVIFHICAVCIYCQIRVTDVSNSAFYFVFRTLKHMSFSDRCNISSDVGTMATSYCRMLESITSVGVLVLTLSLRREQNVGSPRPKIRAATWSKGDVSTAKSYSSAHIDRYKKTQSQGMHSAELLISRWMDKEKVESVYSRISIRCWKDILIFVVKRIELEAVMVWGKSDTEWMTVYRMFS